MIEIDPARFNQALLGAGLSEQEVRSINSEFVKNNYTINDEVLLNKLLEFHKGPFTIITIFDRLGIGKNNAVRMMEMRQKQKLGALVNIFNLEVEG